ncbi:hypothetical protein HPB51_015217 [Rhipicephalus microplus]|uniref:Uncharacterized protein n=1 Tax=Rhipicephalus microplus TaxID=6941 RepID=A0A9J6EAC4_RHIMP|nr:hypothetical protein HPB51_015217 [Rhipicephalus microplus]
MTMLSGHGRQLRNLVRYDEASATSGNVIRVEITLEVRKNKNGENTSLKRTIHPERDAYTIQHDMHTHRRFHLLLGEWLFFGFLQAENFEAATVAPGQTHRRIAASASWSRLKRRRMDALQETPRSPQEQPLVHTDEESATETTQMDVQTWLPQGSSEEVDNVSAGERHDGAAWTEDGWHTVLTRRQKKNQKKNQKNASEAVECNASSSSPPKQGSQVKRRRRTRSRRPLPPLPKDDIKIILRPHKGLAVKDILGYELSTAVIDACHRHFDGGSFMLRVHPGSNIIIVSTPHEHVAKELREITHLNIRGRVHSFNSYVADPEDVLRGIVHGIPSGTSQAELMANLRVRTQGVKIERARMLGSTKTAIITFTGSTLPRASN